MPKNSEEELYRKFAQSICTIRKWPLDDEYFGTLMDAIRKGQWNAELKIFIHGRQSVLDELKESGHSFGNFAKS